MCSLVHKFRGSDDDAARDEDARRLHQASSARTLPADFTAKGNLFVFVDEAHRTQSGKMHRAMKQLLPDAMFIGFTGTPLLKADKMTSIETFGSFIHTYKFDEAVRDGVVLDLATRRATSTRSSREPRRSTSGSTPRPRADRSLQGAAQEEVGHDAEGRLGQVPRRDDRPGHPHGLRDANRA